MIQQKICLIGQVLVDVTLSPTGKHQLRLGGLLHAARALWALGIGYELAYIAPEYLSGQIDNYAKRHGASKSYTLGTVTGAPNVILVTDPTEAGPQRYELLLRDEHESHIREERLKLLANDQTITDILIFSGGFSLEHTLQAISLSSSAIHADIAYGVGDVEILGENKRGFDTIMMSTSSELFLKTFRGNPDQLKNVIVPRLSRALIFKENRGGSRFFTKESELRIPSQTRPIVHSVGVGDVFDASFLALSRTQPPEVALAYSAHIAADYASTTYPDDFKDSTGRTIAIPPEKLKGLGGISLPWENRPQYPVYIAAPDFNYLDRRPIEKLCEALNYHNFTFRRPVAENGQAHETDDYATKFDFFHADLSMLAECRLVIAVLLIDDPGTLIEIGIAAEKQMPVIIYDPYKRAKNLFLQILPTLLTNSLDEVISETFRQLSKLNENNV